MGLYINEKDILSLKDDLDKNFLTLAKQIRDKIQLEISIAVTN